MKKFFALLLVLCMMLSLTACGLSFGSREVRFELNGGTLVSGDLLQKVKVGGSAKAPTVERDGYEFTGWNEDIDDVRDDIVAGPSGRSSIPSPSIPTAANSSPASSSRR